MREGNDHDHRHLPPGLRLLVVIAADDPALRALDADYRRAERWFEVGT